MHLYTYMYLNIIVRKLHKSQVYSLINIHKASISIELNNIQIKIKEIAEATSCSLSVTILTLK